MLVRQDGEESLLVLVALNDANSNDHLAASLAELDDIVLLTPDDIAVGDHAQVAVVDDAAAVGNLPPGTPVVLLSDHRSETVAHGVVAATMRIDADPVLIGAAARLVAAGYRISGDYGQCVGSPTR